MSRLAVFALQALCLASNASPLLDESVKLVQPKLPVDPSFIRPVAVVPEIITIPIQELKAQSNGLGSQLIHEPFSGLIPDSSAENDTLTRRVVGTDDRYQYTDRNYPFRTIGKLIWTTGSFCSAFTQGPRVIVAAKHCIPASGVGITFYPAIDNGNAPYGSFPVTNIITNSYPRDSTPCDWENDWAIFIVNSKVGNSVGWMGVKAPDPAQVGKPYLYNLGYPADKDNGQRPYKQDGITALTQYENNSANTCDAEPYVPLYSNQDTSQGQSGSPIWELANNLRYVWGVTSVSSSQLTASASGQALVQAIMNANRDYP